MTKKSRKERRLEAAKKAKAAAAAAKVSASLETWGTLIEALPKMTEKELSNALEIEARRPLGERRLDIIKRLHRRVTRVRKERELQEYLT